MSEPEPDQADHPAQTTPTAGDKVARPLRTCEDYQALIPAMVDGSLSRGRTVLLADHLRRCSDCHQAMALAANGRGPGPAPARQPHQARRWPLTRVAGWIAAAVVILAASVAVTLVTFSPAARVTEISGELLVISPAGERELAVGDSIRRLKTIATDPDSTALLSLRGGSTIEMSADTRLTIRRRRLGQTIDLERGTIIVDFVPGLRPLSVTGGDFVVKDQGSRSVITASREKDGGRVGVITGSAKVRIGRTIHGFGSGGYLAIDDDLGPVRVKGQNIRQEIAWSRRAQKYTEFLDQAAGPCQHHAAKDRALSTLIPPATALGASLPDLDSFSVVGLNTENSLSNTIRAWWAEQVLAPGRDAQLGELLSFLQPLSPYIAGRIQVALPAAGVAGTTGPLVLARLHDPAAFARDLGFALASSSSEKFSVVSSPFAGADPGAEWLLWINDDLLAAAPGEFPLQVLCETLRHPAEGRPIATDIQRLTATHLPKAGGGTLIAADMTEMLAVIAKDRPEAAGGILHSVGAFEGGHMITITDPVEQVPALPPDLGPPVR